MKKLPKILVVNTLLGVLVKTLSEFSRYSSLTYLISALIRSHLNSLMNTIRRPKWMAGVKNATVMIGCIGKDKFGQLLKDRTENDGVSTRYLLDEQQPTGTCAVLITGHDRSLVANLAAASNYKLEHLKHPKTWALVENAKVFYITGFFLAVSLESIVAVAEHAALSGKYFCMNLSAPFLSEFYFPALMEVAPYWDLLFGNETEAKAFAQRSNFSNQTDIPAIALQIAQLPKKSGLFSRTVIITQGELPTVVVENGLVSQFPIQPLPKEKIVDTNGAGDAFVGGFLSQFMAGKSTPDCVKAGHYAASVVIQRSGCTFPKECLYRK
eukprot:Sdes_comp20767_c0_seq3m16782